MSLGKYRLRADQILRLGRGQTKKVTLEEESSIAISQSSQKMSGTGFAPFQQRGVFLVSSASQQNFDDAPHVGQYRVTFEYDTCGPVTIIAQQVMNEEGQNTFRKWNPEKIRVPYGQSTDADSGASYGNPLCCYICMCVDCMCSAAFEEVVDEAVDTKMTATSYFEGQETKIAMAARYIRPLGILMTIFGFFLLFSPVIALLKWIPLVGWLLGGIVAIAAALFSLVVGSVISLLVIAIAWVFYRPLIGITMLVGVSIGVYFIFFYGKGEVDTSEVEDANEAEPTVSPSTPAITA